MSLKNQKSTGAGVPILLVGLLIVAAAVGAGFAGYSVWLLTVGTLAILLVLFVLGNLHDIVRYLKMRTM